MKNKFTLSLFVTFAILLAACGPQATSAPASTAKPSTNGGGGAAAAPAVVATDTTAPADNSGYGNYGNSSQAQPTTASNPSTGGEGATLSVGPNSFLVGANSMTLYLLTTDPAGASNCTGRCASTWPPLTVTGQPAAGTGVNASLLGTTMRADGSTQVTYKGHPLYFYMGDSAPGDKNGEGSGGVWFVVSASGDAIKQ